MRIMRLNFKDMNWLQKLICKLFRIRPEKGATIDKIQDYNN